MPKGIPNTPKVEPCDCKIELVPPQKIDLEKFQDDFWQTLSVSTIENITSITQYHKVRDSHTIQRDIVVSPNGSIAVSTTFIPFVIKENQIPGKEEIEIKYTM